MTTRVQTRAVPARTPTRSEPPPARPRAPSDAAALARALGNRAFRRLVVARWLPMLPTPPSRKLRRKIVIDANVFDQPYRGNIPAAQRLKDLAANHDVYVSWQAAQEWVVNPEQRAGADTARLIIDELKIKMAPPAPQQVLDELRAKNTFGKGGYTGTILSATKDLNVAAEAKAIDAEVWSFDSSFRNGAVQKTLGVKVADETMTIKHVGGRNDPRTGLRLLKIKRPVPAGQLPAGSAPAPITPPPTPAPAKAPAAPTAGKDPAGGPGKGPDAPTPKTVQPAPHATEPTAHEPAPKSGGSKVKTGGGVLIAVAPWILGYLHERTRAGRVADRAKEQGYVPGGDHGGFWDVLGDLVFDPTGEGERAVPVSARVNMAKWRQDLRGVFSGHRPGDTVVFHWDYYRGSRAKYSRWFIYMLGDDGRWFIAREAATSFRAHLLVGQWSAQPQERAAIAARHTSIEITPRSEVPPDINDVIDPSVPDSTVEPQMVYDETIA